MNIMSTYLKDFSQFNPTIKNEHLIRMRQQAIDQFEHTGLPSNKHEQWRYTNLKPITKQDFDFVPDGQGDQKIDEHDFDLSLFSKLVGYRLVFVNNHYIAALSEHDDLPQGVTICDLNSALSDHPDTMQYLNHCAAQYDCPFTKLNTAFINQGCYIKVDDKVQLDQPIYMIYLNTDEQRTLVTHPRNVIILGEQAQAEVIEYHHHITDNSHFTNVVTETILSKQALCHYTQIISDSLNHCYIGKLYSHQAEHSMLHSNMFSLGGKLTCHDIHSSLAEEHAAIRMNGLYMGNGEQHSAHRTHVDHLSPHTQSDERYHGVLDDDAHGVFKGKVVVHQDAQKTIAHQVNKNLLLSADAEIDTQPQLEIYADDVQCTHGATVSQLDQQSLFYMRTRAIDLPTAKKLLMAAFIKNVIDDFNTALCDHIHHIIAQKTGDDTMQQT